MQEVKNAADSARITDKGLLIKAGISVMSVLISFLLSPLLNANVALLAVIGAIGLLIMASPRNISGALELVEWNTLIFFAGLFVLVEAIREAGLIDAIAGFIMDLLQKVSSESRQTVAMTIILWTSALISIVLDNIPWTAVMVRVVEELGQSPNLNLSVPSMACSLSLGACLGDNGSLIGASANVVMVSMAEKRGYPISFLGFSSIGFPLLVGAMVLCNGYLIARYG